MSAMRVPVHSCSCRPGLCNLHKTAQNKQPIRNPDPSTFLFLLDGREHHQSACAWISATTEPTRRSHLEILKVSSLCARMLLDRPLGRSGSTDKFPNIAETNVFKTLSDSDPEKAMQLSSPHLQHPLPKLQYGSNERTEVGVRSFPTS
ncbi:hypothetical protein BGZ60DRAFT_423940 [Tricladium varicosporioides]|nr:hypothetical protein BGZ60DRAFT_423940 [Hymenoscyphus varicosporioides]